MSAAPPNPIQYLLLENLLFLAISTAFLVVVGYSWRNAKPFSLPQPLPGWFPLWFGSVQLLGGVLPTLVVIWGLWQGNTLALLLLLPYLLILGLQILAEAVTLRWYSSVVWVMVPYLYVPFRLWQLWEGRLWLDSTAPSWLAWLLVAETGVWLINYLLDLAQLPRLFQWPQA